MSIALLAADGRSALTNITEPLERWRNDFGEVGNVSMKVVETLRDNISEESPQETNCDVDY